MHVQFFGAAREVTGSMHLVDTGRSRVLLDCGLYQGRRKGAFERNRDIPFNAGELDSVVLSHAHLDHAGNLPSLVRAGYRGPIWTTHASADLCRHMLMDSAHIQVNDVKYVNRRRLKKGLRPFEPLYDQADVDAVLELFRTVDYGESFEPAAGVQGVLRDAGHILGSASVTLDVSGQRRDRRLVFSGDIGRRGLPILRDPVVPDGADFVIMESTYGDRVHEPASEAKAQLRAWAARVHKEGGYLIIPAFALGRTQEIVYRLNQLWEEGELPRMPVWVDSPLAVRVTDVFNRHPECWDEEMLETMKTDRDKDPLGFETLSYVRDVEESKALNTRRGPGVIISASGMCEAGRILHHLKNHGTKPQSTILFVGYQADHTLGRKILSGKNPVPIYGEDVVIRAQVERADSYSAHAGRNELLAWAAGVEAAGNVGTWCLVHGETDAQSALATALVEAGAARVSIPERGQKVEF